MKTIKYLSLRVFAVAALALVFALPTKAQMTDNGYANIDWQYNFSPQQQLRRQIKRLGYEF